MFKLVTELPPLMAAVGSRAADLTGGRLAATWRGLSACLLGLFLMGHMSAQSADRVAYSHSALRETTTPAADFGTAAPAPDARQLADWIARTQDHHGRPFFLIDKVDATLYVFDGNVRLRASTPVLLGAARGDDSLPDIGTRPMLQILPAERTTPAGRFMAEVGRNLQGEDIVWVDHDAAVSMHRVRTGNPATRRNGARSGFEPARSTTTASRTAASMCQWTSTVYM